MNWEVLASRSDHSSYMYPVGPSVFLDPYIVWIARERTPSRNSPFPAANLAEPELVSFRGRSRACPVLRSDRDGPASRKSAAGRYNRTCRGQLGERAIQVGVRWDSARALVGASHRGPTLIVGEVLDRRCKPRALSCDAGFTASAAAIRCPFCATGVVLSRPHQPLSACHRGAPRV